MIKTSLSFLTNWFLYLSIVGFFLVTFTLYLPSQAALNEVFVVNTNDNSDDGDCNAAHCSLLEAINAANNAHGADTIIFTLPPTTTIGMGLSPLPIISDTLTIDGSTAQNLSVSGVYDYSIFHIDTGATVTITTLTIGGGVTSDGAGIFNGGTVNIIGSTIAGNYAYGYGGGIYNQGGTVNISSSTIAGNVGEFSGGGVVNFGGMVNISDSTLTGNTNFVGDGGGIANFGGELKIDNSTFVGNHCFFYHSYCNGGGIYIPSGVLYISNSTFNGNWAGGMGGIPPFGGGIFGGEVHLSNTIIANSGGGDCVAGLISTNINNLISDGSCNPTFNGNPMFGLFQDNGGPTWTVALSPLSQAVDNGDDDICAAPPIDNLDQRGVIRPIDGDGDGVPRCDIGAYEYDGPPPSRSFLPILRHD